MLEPTVPGIRCGHVGTAQGPLAYARRVSGALEANVLAPWHMTARRCAKALAGGSLWIRARQARSPHCFKGEASY